MKKNIRLICSKIHLSRNDNVNCTSKEFCELYIRILNILYQILETDLFNNYIFYSFSHFFLLNNVDGYKTFVVVRVTSEAAAISLPSWRSNWFNIWRLIMILILDEYYNLCQSFCSLAKQIMKILSNDAYLE